MIYGVTGHRPPKLGGYNAETIDRLARLANSVICAREDGEMWITGMAQGWDLAIAEACITQGVPFHAGLAHPQQDSLWPHEQKERFKRVLSHAANVTIVSDEPSKGAYHVRDHWIVMNCDELVALWNGDRVGGTWATVRSAQKQNRPMVNVWPEWYASRPDTLWEEGF